MTRKQKILKTVAVVFIVLALLASVTTAIWSVSFLGTYIDINSDTHMQDKHYHPDTSDEFTSCGCAMGLAIVLVFYIVHGCFAVAISLVALILCLCCKPFDAKFAKIFSILLACAITALVLVGLLMWLSASVN